MKKKIFILPMLALTALFTFSACGGDSNDDFGDGGNGNGGNKTETSQNANANKAAGNVPTEATRLEFPKVKGDANNLIIVHKATGFGVNYSLEWDCTKKAQRWCCYQMYAGNSTVNWNRKSWEQTSWKGDPFQEDTKIPEQYRTKLSDYSGSGYQRGHICPSADRLYSQQVNEQTFYLSNMHPQIGTFNTGIWEKMEEQVRAWNVNTFRDTLFVCKGGTIDKTAQIKGYTRSGLLVPKYFFMAVLCKQYSSKDKKWNYKAIGFWIEHQNSPISGDKISNYVVSIDELEKNTGIDFFCNLPDDIENRVEAVNPKNNTAVITAWKLTGK